MDLIFTHIYEHARAAMGISADEYRLCNYILVWSSYPGSARLGWCNRTLEQKATFIGITSRGLTKMQNRMIDLGLIQKDPITAHTRTTVAWFEIVNAAKDREQSSHPIGNKVPTKQGTKFPQDGEQSSHEAGNKVPTHSNGSLFIENNDFVVIDGDAVSVPPVDTVVDFLNQCLNPARPFSKTTKKTVEAVNARIREKYTVDDICLVIEFKTQEWLGDPKMEQYIRPETLFGTGKFEGYLVAATTWASKGKPSKFKNGYNGTNGIGKNTPQVADDATAGAFKNY